MTVGNWPRAVSIAWDALLMAGAGAAVTYHAYGLAVTMGLLALWRPTR